MKNISLDRYKQRFFGDFLALTGLTEIAVNRPGELFTKINGIWEQHTVPLDYEGCYNFARCLAKHHGDNIEDIKPGLSATLESGERCQVIVPPACERNTVSITLRKPSQVQIPHQDYIAAGFYNRVTGTEKTQTHDQELLALYNAKDIPRFMEKCVEYGKTIAVAGETSTGKTTYMKMLIGYIPCHLRITTIEDNPEIALFMHKNYVHLFYPSESADEKGSIVTPASLLRWNYRMNPDRILFGQKDRNTDYTENSRQAMADMARTTLENSINIPPTLYKNQGEIINLITGQDIDFSGIYTLRMKSE